MKQPCRFEKDQGAALVTVLTMLAILSVLAIVVADAANMSVRRTSNLVRMEQSRWYLLGAEAFARAQLVDLARRGRTAQVDEGEWQARVFSFPLDDGAMQVTLRDGGNCFNLNSLVIAEEGGRASVSPVGMVHFARLLDAAGVGAEHEGLSAALIDWLDTDTQPMPGGAEGGYGGGDQYRTANTLLADLGELRRVRGFTPEIIERIAPLACVRPTTAPNQINPNTLRVEQAALLTLAADDLTVDQAAAVIRDRPRGGWATVDDFLLHPTMSALSLNETARAQFSVFTRYYILAARVERTDAVETSVALLEQDQNGRAAVLRRLFGAGRSETLL